MKWWVLCALALAAPAQAQVRVDWVQEQRGTAIALDRSDNVFTLDYEQALGSEMTLTKRSSEGALLWTARHDQADATKWERAAWLETDSQGNAIVAGTMMSGYSNPVVAASVLMKFSPAGALLWRTVFESSFDGSSLQRCLVDADDNIYTVGLGSGPPGYVTKVRKFTPGGSVLWTWYDAAGIGAPIHAKLTPDGGLLVVGRGIYGSVNGYAKLDGDGRLAWSLAGVPSLTAGDAAGDRFGNTYVVHGVYAANGGTTVRKLGPAGEPRWSRDFALSGFRVEVGPDDRPVVCGFPNAGTGGAAFVKVREDGETAWSNLDADGPLGLLLHARLLVDRAGNAYLAAGTLFEMAVCKVTVDGDSDWTLTMPRSYANGMAIGGDGNVYVVGGATARVRQPSPFSTTGVPGEAAAIGPWLEPGRPNPARGAVAIRYALPGTAPTELRVFDLSGREVAVLADGVQGPGAHALTWDAGGLAPGIYWLRLRHGTELRSRKLVVAR